MPHDLKILIIDDSQDDADILLLELRLAGYRAIAKRVCTEQTLIDALSDSVYDIIFVDHTMPGFSGLRACKMVREWDEQWVQIKLEQSAVFDGERVLYLGGRQTRWHLIR